MKRISALLLASLLATTAAHAAERQITIEVSGLTCPSCPYIAAKAVEKIDTAKILGGVYNQAAETVVFKVSYDDAVTNAKAIAAASDEYGYPGRIVSGAKTGLKSGS